MHAREVVPDRTAKRQHPILNFEQADNFVLAYYAAGEAQAKGLPFREPPAIEPEPGAWRTFVVNKSTIGDNDVQVNVDTIHDSTITINLGGQRRSIKPN